MRYPLRGVVALLIGGGVLVTLAFTDAWAVLYW